MKTIRRLVLVPLAAAIGASPAAAAPPSGTHPFCATDPAEILISDARHDFFQRRLALARRDGRAPLKSAPAISRSGYVAVLDDDGTVTTLPRPFDLEGLALRFLRRPRGMSAGRSPLGVKQLIGDKIELTDDGSQQIELPEGFRFPFGGQSYDSVFVNANGNLTFGRPDPTIGGIGALLFGPPRIAALFTDLDPSAAVGEDGVYVFFLPGRARITWRNVPEFDTENRNTVQVTLYENGRVNVAFGEVEAAAPIVGVSPDQSLELLQVDLDVELPVAPRNGSIVEQFTQLPEVDLLGAVQLFAQQFADVYDAVFVWLDFPAVIPGFAFSLPLRNEVRGIGFETFDNSFLVPASQKLENVVQMGDLSRFPDDPDEIFMTTASTMTIVGHEFGHRWLASVRFIDAGGGESSDLLNGPGGVHWSFHMSSQGSLMHGNDWRDNGDGTFTATDGAHTRYSPLDRYLMGIASPASVGEFFYIADPDGGDRGALPVIDQTVAGRRVDLTLADVVAAEGPRRPARAASPNSFRTAFLVVGLTGQGVSQEAITKVDRYRERWSGYFHEATGRRGEVLTTLFPR